MVLWTPNRKTVEAVRVCPRCGGYERSVADRRDFNRYLSLHRICCCEPVDCNEYYLRATLSGIDLAASSCYGCLTDGTHSFDYQALNVDGIYDLDPVSMIYALQTYSANDAGHLTGIYYDSATDCTGSTDDAGEGMTISVVSPCSSGVITITNVDVIVSNKQGGNVGGTLNVFDATGTFSIGEDIDNELSSCSSVNGSIGGTVTITTRAGP